MTTAPNDLTKAEKERWESLVAQLIEHQLDPEQRRELLVDFVKADRRIAALRKTEDQIGVPGSRALNVAMAERRRLYKALFVGGRRMKKEAPPPPLPQAELDADAAWREFFTSRRGQMSAAERKAWEEAIEAKHGEPSWRLLIWGLMGLQPPPFALLERVAPGSA